MTADPTQTTDFVQIATKCDKLQIAAIPWRAIDTGPQGVYVKVLVADWSEWTYSIFERGVWRDSNGTPIDAVAWSPCAGDENE